MDSVSSDSAADNLITFTSSQQTQSQPDQPASQMEDSQLAADNNSASSRRRDDDGNVEFDCD